MSSTMLKVQNLFRTDSHTNSIAAASSLILGVAEPYYIHNYFNSSKSEYEDIICIGDGSSTLASLLTNKKYFVAGYGAGYDLPKATESDCVWYWIAASASFSTANLHDFSTTPIPSATAFHLIAYFPSVHLYDVRSVIARMNVTTRTDT